MLLLKPEISRCCSYPQDGEMLIEKYRNGYFVMYYYIRSLLTVDGRGFYNK